MSRLHRGILAAAVVLGASACQADPAGFAVTDLEAALVDELDDVYDRLTLFGVDCPHGALGESAKAGDVFACTADVERQFVRIRVELTDSLGGYEWNTLDVVHDMQDTEGLVQAEMSTALDDTIDLDCGSPRIRVLPVGSSILCEATDSGRNRVRVLLSVLGAGQTGWEVLG